MLSLGNKPQVVPGSGWAAAGTAVASGASAMSAAMASRVGRMVTSPGLTAAGADVCAERLADGLGFEPKTALRLYSISSAAPSTGLGHPSSREKSSGGVLLSLLRSNQDIQHPKRVWRRQTGAAYSRNRRRHVDSGVGPRLEVVGDDHSMWCAFAARSTLGGYLIVRPQHRLSDEDRFRGDRRR